MSSMFDRVMVRRTPEEDIWILVWFCRLWESSGDNGGVTGTTCGQHESVVGRV